ncbi:hypothetical protein [Polynucleobacter asymbioticus]|jgi:hypothetical protein|uniref:hypothetical protein n=1 Tax=Polynucleobacter asymbioticus TaxID=576611 RepID=UPI0008F8583C|nr:hypothetical protein [Polynucleobacter asymbioticus]APC05361.1 hypothetical protein AOC10_01855 [Polynucleobacter asymbioticus]
MNKKLIKMKGVTICNDQVNGFFDRARVAAQKADRGEIIEKSITFSFEGLRQINIALLDAHGADLMGKS